MRLTSRFIVAIGGVFAATAAIAAATQVNIVDPTATTRIAKVEVGNRLAVQEVTPSTYYHSTFGNLNSGAGCTVVATPPAGKALIVRQVRVDVYDDSTPQAGQGIAIFSGTNCTVPIGDIVPPGIGLQISTFDPGFAIPHGSGLSMQATGNVSADVYVDAYKVDSSVVPQAGGQTIEVRGSFRHHG